MGKAKTSTASTVVQKVRHEAELTKSLIEPKSWYRAACPSGRTDKEILELVESLKGDDAAICRSIDDWWSQTPKQEEDEGWVTSEKRKKKEKVAETTADAGHTSGGRGRGGPRGYQERSGGRGITGERRSGRRERNQEVRGVNAQPKPNTASLRGGRGRGRVNVPVVSQKPTTQAWATPSTEGPSGGWAAAVRDGGRQAAAPAPESAASEDVERLSASASGASIFVSSSSTPATRDGSNGGSGSGAWGPSKELAGRGGGGWGDKEVVTSGVSQEPGTTAALAGDADAWGAGGVPLPSTSVWSNGSASIINPKPKEKIIVEAPASSPAGPPPTQTKPIVSNTPVKQDLPPPSPQKTQQQPTPPKPPAPQKHPKKPASSPLPVQVPPASDAEGLKMGKWDQGFDTGADQSLSFSFGSLGLGSGSQVAAQTGWNGEPKANAPGGSGVQGGTSTNFSGFPDSKQSGAPASAASPTAAVSPHIKAQPTPDTSKSVAATVSATVSAPPVSPATPGSEAGPPPGLPPLTGKVTQVHELEAELDRKKAQHQQAQAAAVGLAATATKSAPPSAVVDSTQPTARSQPSVTTSQPPPISGSVASSATSSSSGPPRGGRRGVGGNTSQYNSGTAGGNFTGGYVGPATPTGIAIQAQHVAPSGNSHHGMSAGQVPGGYAPPQGMHTQQGYTFPQQYGAQLYGYNPYFYAQGAYHAAYNQQGGDRGFAQAMPRGYPADYSTQASMMGYGMEYGQAAPAQGQYNEAQGQYSMAQSGQALQQPPGGVGGGRRGVGGSALKGGGGQQQGGGNKGGGASPQQPSPPPPSILQSGGVPREFGAGSSGTTGMPGSGYMYNVPPQGMGMAGADQQHYAGSAPQWGGMIQQGHPTSGPTSMNPAATHYPSSMGAHVNLGASQGQQYSTSGAPGGGGQQQYGTSGEGHSWSQT